MFQILFGIGTDNSEQTWIMDALRTFCSLFDMVVYELISIVYQILFTIADSSILTSEYVKTFYNRFQIIIGVFMIFKLAMNTLQYVVNPDMISDKKAGVGNVIVRIIGMLAMYTAIMPLSIPNTSVNSYEAYLNDYGLLFGTMYSLQYRILSTNTIEKIVYGNSAGSGSGQSVREAGNAFSVNILKTFVKPNTACNNGTCYPQYDMVNDPIALLEDINEYTDTQMGWGGERYHLAYFPIIPTVVGVIIIYVLIHFCIDVAIRALKLAILRIIAPIPIISYVDPKSSEKGAFANWIKQIISTFAQLFIVLAIMHFAFDIIGRLFDPNQDVLDIPITNGVNFVNTFATVLIVLAVLLFARQAPKFIMDILGIKGTGLIGISGALGGIGSMMGGGGLQGLASGSLDAMQDASDAAAQGKAAPPAYSGQRDKMVQKITGDKNARGGILGGMQRAANDYTNNAVARRLFGIDRNMVGQAKDEMYTLKSAASAAEERYKRLANGNMTNQEKNAIANNPDNLFDEWLQANHGTNLADWNANGDQDEKDNLLTQFLEEDWGNKQTAAGKQEAWYNDGNKMLEGLDINETLQEKYAVRGRNLGRMRRLYDANRDGYTTPINRDYARSHQHRTNPRVGTQDATRFPTDHG